MTTAPVKKLKIMVTGDVHANWSGLNDVLNNKRPDIVLVCGDFGYWPEDKEEKYDMTRINTQGGTIHWCDGNHENHHAIRDLKSNVIRQNIIYQPRGSTLTLPDGRTVMFFGGADSHDKEYRILNIDWFKEEIPSQTDLDRAMAFNGKVDIMISHTCPQEIPIFDDERSHDPTRKMLSILWEKYRPSLWYFGHWHRSKLGKFGETTWRALDYATHPNWWCWLPN